jgi:hypothetical protein
MAQTLSAFNQRVCAGIDEKCGPAPQCGFWGPGFVLSVRVAGVVVVVMMVMRGREHGARKHHQEHGNSENLFHGTNVAWTPERGKRIQRRASREALGLGSGSGAGLPGVVRLPRRSVDWEHDE